MSKDTLELLKECNAGCKSATNSMEQVQAYVKDSQLRKIIEQYNKEHILLLPVPENEEDSTEEMESA